MPTKRRRRARMAYEDVKPAVVHFLLTGERRRGLAGVLDTFVLGEADFKALWDAHGEQLLAEFVAEHPGTRPWAWWKFAAPGLPERLGGTGDVWHAGIEVYAIEPGDPEDPPVFESVPGFLRRHGLLTSVERRRLRAVDFEPEAIGVGA
jgi:hypothetical protein